MHDAFEAAVLHHPRIMECHATVGDEDYLLKDLTKGMPGLDEFLRQDFWRLPGVRRFSTTIAMRTIKSTASLLENTNT
jgi:Lrp/AsnC family leucine-responsive transcriptional regulator